MIARIRVLLFCISMQLVVGHAQCELGIGQPAPALLVNPVRFGLQVTGSFPPEGGLIVADVDPSGPGTHLWLMSGATASLQPNDAILAIDAQNFTQSSYYKLMNNGAMVRGRVLLTVQDASTRRISNWLAQPVRIRELPEPTNTIPEPTRAAKFTCC